MKLSIFDLFSVGLGPSSSHTIGPMTAANLFLKSLIDQDLLTDVDRVEVELFGSLAFTGVGHRTDAAILLGLEAYRPEQTLPEQVLEVEARVLTEKRLHLASQKWIDFAYDQHFQFKKGKFMPFHSNAMRIKAFKGVEKIYSQVYYSIGGGFVLDHEQMTIEIEAQKSGEPAPDIAHDHASHPFHFNSAQDLLDLCRQHQKKPYEIILANEISWSSEKEVQKQIDVICSVMRQSIERGLKTDGVLPGGLKVKRRAKGLHDALSSEEDPSPLQCLDWVSAFAIAVNEENAAGSRVVTAPTNGAAGVIPAILLYIERFLDKKPANWQEIFLLTSGAIGLLYKEGASLSAAEVGCQGEVGVACSMAAAGLTAVQGGTPEQIENAAEIAMEHHLGLTCDPVAGLVQIPCIERNSMGAIKAINSARLAIRGDGTHIVSLDKVIKTMLQTGKDMQSIYKETSEGGLAVNVIEC